MKNEVITRFRAIVKRHTANNKKADDIGITDGTWAEEKRLKEELTVFIRTELFANLTKQDILTLVYLCYKYNVMPLHSLGPLCEKQAHLLK